MQDRIEKTVELKAPVTRVWKALTHHEEFGEWFQVELDGPFAVGETSTGKVTYPGCEHLQWEAKVNRMDPEYYFSFSWCPYEVTPTAAEGEKPSTLVEFSLESSTEGTRLTISESGFNALPGDERRKEAFLRNSNGWDEQSENIASYVESRA